MTMQEFKEGLGKASNLRHRNGRYHIDKFMKKTGLNPLHYTKYFLVTGHGLVVFKASYYDLCDSYHDSVKRNWINGLGVSH